MTTATIRNAATDAGLVTAAFFVRNSIVLVLLAALTLIALARA